MDLITMILILMVIGILMYVINTYVPMEARIKTILNWAVVIACVLWLLNIFGILPLGMHIPVGRVR